MFFTTKKDKRIAELEQRLKICELDLGYYKSYALQNPDFLARKFFTVDLGLKWHDDDRPVLQSFLDSPVGVRLMNVLSQWIVNQSLSAQPLTDRKDGARQGACLMLDGIRSLAKPMAPAQPRENYQPLNFNSID